MIASIRAVLLAVSLAGLLSVPAVRAEPRGALTQVVDGYDVYFGIMPSALVRASGMPHIGADVDAHGRPRGDFSREHHLVVALFERGTGRRVENASITASVPIGGRTVTRTLEPMRINDATSFGNSFVLGAPGRYRFTVTARIPGREAPLVAVVEYRYRHPVAR